MPRHFSVSFCVLVFGLGLAHARPPGRQQGWKELAGAWQPHSRESEGKKEIVPKDVADNLELVISENMVVVKEDGKVNNLKFSVKILIDKSPAWVDFIVTAAGDTPDVMKTCPGIYKLEGDTLTVCYREPHADVKRPTEFATKKGDDVILVVFKKKKAS
jgi:uncharacterized protein (TIGR03067 family)